MYILVHKIKYKWFSYCIFTCVGASHQEQVIERANRLPLSVKNVVTVVLDKKIFYARLLLNFFSSQLVCTSLLLSNNLPFSPSPPLVLEYQAIYTPLPVSTCYITRWYHSHVSPILVHSCTSFLKGLFLRLSIKFNFFWLRQ